MAEAGGDSDGLWRKTGEMPRAIWNGSISFGLVNIPVKLFSAVSKKSVQFHQLDARTGARIRQQRVSSVDGTEVPYDQIVKGYELHPGNYVIIEPGELDALDPEATHTIDLDAFIDLADIDPIFFDSPYYLAPLETGRKPYALLVKAMEEEKKVGVARFVLRTKQYLAAMRAKDGVLLISTMVYPDEIQPTDAIEELDGLEDLSVSDRELTMARQLIESLSTSFNPDQYSDTYRQQVLDLIERKAAGEDVTPGPQEQREPAPVGDLVAALEKSVQAARIEREHKELSA